MSDTDVVADLVYVLFKTGTRGITKEVAQSLAPAIIAGLQRKGLSIVDEDDIISPPDTHLSTLKSIRRTVLDQINDSECSARDLAALSLRAMALSREVHTLEERYRAEAKKKGGKSRGEAETRSTAGTSAGSFNL